MEGPWRVGESLLRSNLTLAGYETSCSLHYPGGFTLHSAHATEVWLVNTYIPMDGKIKKVLNIVVMVVVVLWLLNVFGVWGRLHGVRVTMHTPSLDVPTLSLILLC
jgi:hypothetical protein